MGKWIWALTVLASLIGCSAEWFPEDVTSTNTTNTPNTSTNQFTNTTTSTQPPFSNSTSASQNPTTPLAIDPTGKIQVTGFDVLENFRNATNVNFSFIVEARNTDTAKASIGITLSGVNASGTEVYGKVVEAAIDSDVSKHWSVSVGEPLTIAEWESITEWKIIKVEIY